MATKASLFVISALVSQVTPKDVKTPISSIQERLGGLRPRFLQSSSNNNNNNNNNSNGADRPVAVPVAVPVLISERPLDDDFALPPDFGTGSDVPLLVFCDYIKDEYERYGDVACECVEVGDEIQLTCQETDCQFCNQDFTICGITTYGIVGSDTLDATVSTSIELTGDSSISVLFEENGCSIDSQQCTGGCRVVVDGTECQSCEFCNEWGSRSIDCENVNLSGAMAGYNFSLNECYYPEYDDYYYHDDYGEEEEFFYDEDENEENNSNYGEEEEFRFEGEDGEMEEIEEEFAEFEGGMGGGRDEIKDEDTHEVEEDQDEGNRDSGRRMEEDWVPVGRDALDFYSTFVYGICIPLDFEFPENDVCSDSVEVSPGDSIVGSLYGATPDDALPCDRDYDDDYNDDYILYDDAGYEWEEEYHYNGEKYYYEREATAGIWYYVIGKGTILHLSTCSENTEISTQISVFMGECDDLDCPSDLTSRNLYSCDRGYGYSSNSVSWLAEDSVTYHILVSSSYEYDLGNFELSIAEIVPGDNDVCSDAIYVAEPDGSLMVGTTMDAKQPVETCSFQGKSSGVWYTVDGLDGAIFRISTCSFITNFQAAISVFSGSCESLDCISRIAGGERFDRYCNYGDTVEWNSDGDTKYYIFVRAEYEEPSDPFFGISILRFVPPENDVCAGAILLDSDTYVEGTTNTATVTRFGIPPPPITNQNTSLYYGEEFQVEDELYYNEVDERPIAISSVPPPFPNYCGREIATPGVWYKVEGTGSGLRVSTCAEETDYESRLSVFSGACGSFQCVSDGRTDYDCFQNSRYNIAASTVSWLSNSTMTYYILVHGYQYASSRTGNFGLTISQFQPPDNDICTEASPAEIDDDIVGSTENAILDSPAHTLPREHSFHCADNSYQYISAPGIWYSVEGTGSGLQASTCSLQTTYDTAIIVFTDSCSNLTCVAGSSWDDSCFFFGSTVSWISEVNTRYYILIHGSYSDAVGQFSLSVTDFVPAANDKCAGAFDIEIDGDEVDGSLANATVDQFEHSYCGRSIQSPGVWYRVTGTDNPLRASTCSSLTDFNTALSVFSGDCDMLQCITGSSYEHAYCGAASYAYGASTASWYGEAGEVYYILVHSEYSSSRGSFGLTVKTFETVENDNCGNAVSVRPGSVSEGSTMNATIDFSSDNQICGYTSFNSPGIWYTVEGTGLGLTASTCSDVTDFSTAISVFTGECGDLTCINSNDYAYDSHCRSRYGSSEVSWGTTEGSTYFILVHGSYQSLGNFVLTLTEFENAPNDLCEEAIEVSTDGLVSSGLMLGATENFPNGRRCGSYADGPGIWFRVVGTGSALRASTCDLSKITETSMSIYSGTCNELVCVAGANVDYRFGCTKVAWISSDASNYYIYVHTNRYNDGNLGSVGVSVVEFEPAENDECVGAEEVASDGTEVVGSTELATHDLLGDVVCPDRYLGYEGPWREESYESYKSTGSAGVWYKVQGTGSGLRASTCSAATDFDATITVFSGECGNLTCVNTTTSYPICEESYRYSAREELWESDSETTYYILVSGFEVGTFGLSISEFKPPDNQDCQGAMGPLQPNGEIISGSNRGATYDGVEACYGYFTSAAVWYIVIGTGNVLRASTCGSNTNFDTYMSVYSGECGNLVCIDGNDDACRSLASEVVWSSVEGTLYYVRLSGLGEQVGDFDFYIDEMAPAPNDFCDDSIPLSSDVPVVGSLYLATSDTVPYCRYSRGDNGVWYEITGNGNIYSLSSCSPDTDIHTQISVYIGSCDDLDCIDNLVVHDSIGCESWPASAVSWISVDEVVYYVLVSNEYGEIGDFELTLTEFEPPVNDVCENAVEVSITNDVAILGTTISASGGDDIVCEASKFSPGVWYVVQGLEGQVLRASTCSSVTNFPTVISVLSGNCDSSECITVSYTYDRVCAGGSGIEHRKGSGATAEWESTSSTYYIVVSAIDEFSSGNFGLTIEEVVRPENDDCIGADTLQVDGPSIKGSTQDAAFETSDFLYCGHSLIESSGVWYEIEGTGSGIRVSTCSNETNYETAISVFSGSCDDLQCVGTNSYFACPQSVFYSASRVSWTSTEGESYYVLVHGAGYYGRFSPVGDFELTATSFEPPINDLCSGALEMMPDVSAVSGSTMDGTFDFNTTNCGSYSDSAGIWYSVVGTGSGLRVSTCSFLTDYDSSISVFSGECDQLTCIIGGSWDSTCRNRGSTASWISELDTTYYILVHGSYSDAAGSFELSVSEFTPAANDQCDGALEIKADDELIEGSLFGATLDQLEQSQCVIRAYGPAVWYTVTGTGSGFRVSTCNGFQEYKYDGTAISVFSGDCGNITCITGNSWDSSCEYYGGSTVTWHSELDTTYYILVHGTNSGDVGAFELSITEFEPPENDQCEGASDIAIDGDVIRGSQVDATFDMVEGQFCGLSIQSPGVWYRLTGQGSGLRASTCSSFTTYDTALSVFAGGCGALRCVSGNADENSYCISAESPYSTSTVSWFAEAGETYYLLVHADYSGYGSFGLSVTSFETVENDVCASAMSLTPDSATLGSTFNATADLPFFNPKNSSCFFFDNRYAGAGVWYSVTGTGSWIKASTCSSTRRFEAGLSVFSGSCENLMCLEGLNYNDECQNYGGWTLSWDSEEDVEYLINVFGPYSPQQGDFELILTSEEPPENDSCYDALPLSDLTEGALISGSTVGASPLSGSTFIARESGGENCASSDESGDLWYIIDGSNAFVTASTCGKGTNFDTQVSIYSGSCDALECVGYGDDDCDLQSSVTWSAESGVKYYVRVHGYALAAGVFELALTSRPAQVLENDDCVDAIEVIPSMEGTFVTGSTEDAKIDLVNVLYCGAFLVSPGVWYRVEGTGTALKASTCSDETDYDTAISVFSGDCGDLTCIDGDTDSDSCASSIDASTILWYAASGTTYFVLVHGHRPPRFGKFGLTIQEIETPSNDLCVNAEPLSVGGEASSGSTTSATFENLFWRECNLYVDSPGIWYSVQGTGSGLEASTCSDNTNFGTSIGIFKGDCDDLECIDVYESGNCDTSSVVQWSSQAGETYYIFVFGASADEEGEFSLAISEFAAVENDSCSSTIEVEVGSQTAGSTSMATVDSGIGRCDDATAVTSKAVWYSTVGNGQRYTASTCDDSNFDTQISVFSGDCDDVLECIGGNDQGCGDQSLVSWETTEDTVYYILVHGWLSQDGDFVLSLESADPPANDECSGAIELIADGSVTTGSTMLASMSDPDAVCDDDTTITDAGVWYSVTGRGGILAASTCTEATNFDTKISVYTGSSCDDLVCIGADDDGGCFLTSDVLWESQPGEVYYILVHGYGTGTFGIEIIEAMLYDPEV